MRSHSSTAHVDAKKYEQMYREAAAALKEAVAAATADQKMLDTQLAQLRQQAVAQAADAAIATAEERKAYEANLVQMQADADRALVSERKAAEEASQAATALAIVPLQSHTRPLMREKTYLQVHMACMRFFCTFELLATLEKHIPASICTGPAAARTTHEGRKRAAGGSSHG